MYNILVCDDEKDIVSALKIYLTADGYRVFEAYNGREALEVLKRQEIHLVLMDIMMPVMDGLEATRRIRALSRSDAQSVVILAMTAQCTSDSISQSQKAGMNGHLIKPLDSEKMIEMILQSL